MRRLWSAAFLAAASFLAACGPDPKELEPGLREAIQDFSSGIIRNDKDKISLYVLPQAGQHNPVGAKDLDTPEGREKINEGNRHFLRKVYMDAGITSEADIPTLMSALTIHISGFDAQVFFEIAAEGRRAAEIVTLRWTKSEKGWRMFDYFREMKMR